MKRPRIPTHLNSPIEAHCPNCQVFMKLAAGEFWPAFCECGEQLEPVITFVCDKCNAALPCFADLAEHSCLTPMSGIEKHWSEEATTEAGYDREFLASMKIAAL